jgi:hypothetical protein
MLACKCDEKCVDFDLKRCLDNIYKMDSISNMRVDVRVFATIFQKVHEENPTLPPIELAPLMKKCFLETFYLSNIKRVLSDKELIVVEKFNSQVDGFVMHCMNNNLGNENTPVATVVQHEERTRVWWIPTWCS